MSIGIGDEFIFIWRIENFSSCYQKTGEMIESPVFVAENVDFTKWRLIFYPKGFCEESKDFISCFLQRVDDDNGSDDIVIDCIVELLDQDDDIFHVKIFYGEKCKTKQMLGSMKFFAVDELTTKMKQWHDDILKIRCRIMKSTEEKRVCVGCEALTEIGIDQHLLLWDVEISGNFKWSKKFELPFQGEPKFEITLTAPDNNITVSIHLIDKPLSLPQSVTFKLYVSNEKLSEVCFLSEICLFESSDEKSNFIFPTSIKKEKLSEGSESYAFTLKCDITAANRIESSRVDNYKYGKTLTEISMKHCIPSTLKTSLRDLLMSGKYCDVHLRADNVVLPAHKCVLASRSPVFSTLFDEDMLEKEMTVIDIADLDEKTLNSFLEFIYTETISEIDYESSLKLLVAADEYEVPSLKEKCSFFLMSKITLANVYEILEVSDMTHEEPLKASVINFILENSSSIFPSDRWSQLLEKNTSLALEILSKLSADLGRVTKKRKKNPELNGTKKVRELSETTTSTVIKVEDRIW